MSKRKPMSKNHSGKLFTKSAKYVHPKNAINSVVPMRGGIRF